MSSFRDIQKASAREIPLFELASVIPEEDISPIAS
jgi:hypothetical protein